MLGSSPLARGTRDPNARGMNLLGLIPARAGNTHRGNPGYLSCWAHPRSRGEHPKIRVRVSFAPGSSPLARGTLRAANPAATELGLIPARAGNTAHQNPLRLHRGAHPRSRGEHDVAPAEPWQKMGSSPLARGTQEAAFKSNANRGLIPARAGNTGCPAR